MNINEVFAGNTNPYIIAEVSQNHDGSLGLAHRFIDAAADCGADAIKFQTHYASEESTPLEPFRIKFSYEDGSRYDYWKRMEFTEGQWKGLYDHAIERGIDFLSSPFSEKAYTILNNIGISAWKFGSGEVFNKTLLKKAFISGKPVIVSSGLSTWKDLDEIYNMARDYNNSKLAILYCVTAYPSKPEQINIRNICRIRERYDCIVGISDHSGTIYPSLAAIGFGAQIVEVHFTLSEYLFGPDVVASVDLCQLKQIKEGTKYIKNILSGEDSLDSRNENKENLKKMFSKSLYYRKNLKKGDIVKLDDIIAKKPNIGIDESETPNIIGHVIQKDVEVDDIVKMEDFQ